MAGSYIVENAKISYREGTAGVLYCSKSRDKVRLGFSSFKNAEIRYCWVFILLKMGQFYYNCGFNLFKMLK